jgi:hypothetical protein
MRSRRRRERGVSSDEWLLSSIERKNPDYKLAEKLLTLKR